MLRAVVRSPSGFLGQKFEVHYFHRPRSTSPLLSATAAKSARRSAPRFARRISERE